jgi:Ca2+-binding EF-hand superfamily protein
MEDFPVELIEQAKHLFEKYDLNKNNLIEFDELRMLMTDLSKEIGIPQPTDEDVNKVMDDTDTNKDKKISREEFLNLFRIIYTMKMISKEEK